MNGGERRFNCMWPRGEDRKRSSDPKIVVERLTETLRFYRMKSKEEFEVYVTGRANNLGQVSGLVVSSSSGKLLPGESNLVPV